MEAWNPYHYGAWAPRVGCKLDPESLLQAEGAQRRNKLWARGLPRISGCCGTIRKIYQLLAYLIWDLLDDRHLPAGSTARLLAVDA